MWKWLRCFFGLRCKWEFKSEIISETEGDPAPRIIDEVVWMECTICGRKNYGVPF